MQNLRVLVVDDLPDVLATVTGVLVDEGYQVSQASNREMALWLLTKEHIDVAILDVRLDESDEDNRDGLKLMHEINAWYPATVVIILTGYADVRMVREALQPDSFGKTPAFAFLVKPNEIEQLPLTIARVRTKILQQSASELLRLLEEGENSRVEFKSSLRWNYRTKSLDNLLLVSVIAAIAGMLNSEGGTVLIGVSDEGEVLGIEQDLRSLRKKNTDGFQLLLTERLRQSIGVEGTPHIHVRFEVIDGACVCVVNVPPSRSPVFVAEGGKFFVRMGNSTRNLDPKDTLSYVQSHWGKVP